MSNKKQKENNITNEQDNNPYNIINDKHNYKPIKINNQLKDKGKIID